MGKAGVFVPEILGVSLVVLAGGLSKRMKRDKLTLLLDGRTLLDWILERIAPLFDEVLVVGNKEYSRDERIRFVAEEYPVREKNALVGMYTGLKRAKHPYALITAGDMPFISPSLVRFLCAFRGYQGVIPVVSGYREPLLAVYHKSCLPVMLGALHEERYKLASLYASLRVHYIEEDAMREFCPRMLSFFNVNTEGDYKEAEDILALLKKGEVMGRAKGFLE